MLWIKAENSRDFASLKTKNEVEMKVKLGIDLSKCSGCRVCELICALVNHRENNPKLARIKIIGQFPEPGGYKIKFKDCTHCGECAIICPQKAIYIKEVSE
jgi:Fe-S-cluster-containing dehydrogenase component